MKNERSLSKTALEMNLHRSTLIHRIKRIKNMAEGVLQLPESRLHLLISYYLDRNIDSPAMTSTSA